MHLGIYMKKTDIKEANKKQEVFKPYSPIKLTVYGKMSKLTAANSSGSKEGSSGTGIRKP